MDVKLSRADRLRILSDVIDEAGANPSPSAIQVEYRRRLAAMGGAGGCSNRAIYQLLEDKGLRQDRRKRSAVRPARHPGLPAFFAQKPSCFFCAYVRVDVDDLRSRCRRNPPGGSGWPEVAVTDWCGEFIESPEVHKGLEVIHLAALAAVSRLDERAERTQMSAIAAKFGYIDLSNHEQARATLTAFKGSLPQVLAGAEKIDSHVRAVLPRSFFDIIHELINET